MVKRKARAQKTDAIIPKVQLSDPAQDSLATIRDQEAHVLTRLQALVSEKNQEQAMPDLDLESDQEQPVRAKIQKLDDPLITLMSSKEPSEELTLSKPRRALFQAQGIALRKQAHNNRTRHLSPVPNWGEPNTDADLLSPTIGPHWVLGPKHNQSPKITKYFTRMGGAAPCGGPAAQPELPKGGGGKEDLESSGIWPLISQSPPPGKMGETAMASRETESPVCNQVYNQPKGPGRVDIPRGTPALARPLASPSPQPTEGSRGLIPL